MEKLELDYVANFKMFTPQLQKGCNLTSSIICLFRVILVFCERGNACVCQEDCNIPVKCLPYPPCCDDFLCPVGYSKDSNNVCVRKASCLYTLPFRIILHNFKSLLLLEIYHFLLDISFNDLKSLKLFLIFGSLLFRKYELILHFLQEIV